MKCWENQTFTFSGWDHSALPASDGTQWFLQLLMSNAQSTFSRFHVYRDYQHSKCSHFRCLLFSVHCLLWKVRTMLWWPLPVGSTVRHFISPTGLVSDYFLIALILTSKTKKKDHRNRTIISEMAVNCIFYVLVRWSSPGKHWTEENRIQPKIYVLFIGKVGRPYFYEQGLPWWLSILCQGLVDISSFQGQTLTSVIKPQIYET